MSTKTLWTVEMLGRLADDDNRYELDEGELVRMSPGGYRHAWVGSRIYHRLVTFVQDNGLGEVLALELGYILGRNPDTLRAPDISFIRKSRLSEIRGPGFPEMAPDLAVEIVSPSNTETQLNRKIEQLLAAGTTTIWVVYPEERKVAVHRRGGQKSELGENDLLEDAELLSGFQLRIGDIF